MTDDRSKMPDEAEPEDLVRFRAVPDDDADTEAHGNAGSAVPDDGPGRDERIERS